METANWTPTPPSGEPDAGDWRSQLPPESRNKIVNKVMETLKRHFQFPGDWDSNEIEKVAKTFEEKMYNAASNQDEYMRKISMKMLTLEKTQNPMPGASANPPDPGTRNMLQQVHIHGQSLPVPLQGNQTQARQQLLSQNIQNNITTPGVQSSSVLSSTLTSVSGLNQNPITGGGCLNTNMQNMSSISQNLADGLISQGIPDNMFENQQRHMQGRLQVIAQQKQQSHNVIYQQQQLQQLSEQSLQQGNLQHSLMQSQIQQQQHNLLQQTQLQVGQQSRMQSSSLVQPSIQSSGQLSTHSMLQQRQQSVPRQKAQPAQTAAVHQQQGPTTQQQQQPQTSQQLLQQQPQLMSQQANASGLQQNQLSGQQNNLGDIQQHQQQRLLGQQNNFPNLQQHRQQFGSHSSFSGLPQHQQQQSFGTKTDQNSLHMLQSKLPFFQRQQAASSNKTQGPHSQAQQTQQQLLSQMQSQPNQLQQQVGLQQQSNISLRDMLQRFPTSGQSSSSLLQSQNLVDQQKHLYQPQRPVPETSSTSLDSTAQTGNANACDWQEEIYQKIRAMKEVYLPELSEQYHKITQHENIHEAANSEQFEKMKHYKTSLQRAITFLNISKNEITLANKDKLVQHENSIINLINAYRPRKLPMQQGQVPHSHMHVMLQTQSQNNQVRSHDDKMNPQFQSMKLQGAMSTIPQSNMTNLQQNSLSCFSGPSNTKKGALVQLQPGCDLDSGRGNAAEAVAQVLPGSLHNPVSATQHANIIAVSSQGGANSLQSNMSSKQNSNMLQNQHLKQQQDHMLQSHLKQHLQRQHVQKQQLLQQQQAKQQLHAQLQTHQMPQLLQMNEANDMNLRQGISVRPAVYQHFPLTHRPGYTHPQLKPGAQFPISSPQLFQVASSLHHQHSSQQVDQQSSLSSITKAGTPLQPGNSPFAVPSPSTPVTPMPGDTEKHITGTSSLSHVINSGHQQTTGTLGSQSLAIGTPGISASPLLEEFTAADGPATNTLASGSGRSSITKQPLERLIKAVTSFSSNVLSASVSDIGSVVSMTDAMAGSGPGNGSRAAVGEDLVTKPKCCLQARNFITHDKETCTGKRRRYTNALPQSIVSNSGMRDDRLKQLTAAEVSELESTATSHVRRPKLEASHALLEEIREINQQLIDTVVDISNEDIDQSVIAAAGEGKEGTVVKCSYIAVALCPSLKSQYSPVTMSPIQPLLLLVPSSYPTCSPVLLDKFPVQVSKEREELSVKAKSKFRLLLRCLSQPLSLEEMARTWDVCARGVILEYSEETGGGSFSTKYGTWDDGIA